jgi:hypothetical protein
MDESSQSIPDAQPDPFYQLLNYSPDIPSFWSPSPEIPDSQEESQSSLYRNYAPATSRDDRIAIQTALKFKIPHWKIRDVLGVTESQIEYTRDHQVTPQKFKAGRKPLLCTPQRYKLEQ